MADTNPGIVILLEQIMLLVEGEGTRAQKRARILANATNADKRALAEFARIIGEDRGAG